MSSRKMLTLRPYQEDTVRGIADNFQESKRVLMVAPTGSGKTVVFSHIARTAVQQDQRVLIMAHRIRLLDQCGDKLYQNYVDYGYINPQYTPRPRCPVQVGTMQTVIKRMHSMDFNPDLIIVDEAHRAMSDTYQEIIKYYKDSYVLGVTATPVRTDGRPLGDMFERMVLGPTTKQLIGMGNLIKPTTHAPLERIDLSGISIGGNGDYVRAAASARMNDSKITGCAIHHYRMYAEGLPTVVFCSDIKHAIDVAAEFRAEGYRFAALHGKMSVAEQKQILRDLTLGVLQGVVSVDLLVEGVDIPMLVCCILLHPTTSVSSYLQMVGRIMRPDPDSGKRKAVLLDHAGLSLPEEYGGHNLPEIDREWTLEVPEKQKRKRGTSVALVRSAPTLHCGKCHARFEVAEICPNCKAPYEPPKRVVDREGTLTEITEEDMMKIRIAIAKEVEEAQTLEELEEIEQRRGFIKGWARLEYKRKNKKLGIA